MLRDYIAPGNSDNYLKPHSVASPASYPAHPAMHFFALLSLVSILFIGTGSATPIAPEPRQMATDTRANLDDFVAPGPEAFHVRQVQIARDTAARPPLYVPGLAGGMAGHFGAGTTGGLSHASYDIDAGVN